jgi:Glycoside hydrolase 123, catalytic domain/Glycoside hydrolase 123 N-terminal domain
MCLRLLKTSGLLIATAAMAVSGMALSVTLPNPSFEEGQDGPDGWTLSGGEGAWIEGAAADGRKAVVVRGDGKNNNYWRSAAIPFAPSSVYSVRFRARGIGGSSGTPTTGPVFCNRDLGKIAGEWKSYASVFMTPATITPDQAWLKFGQWHVDGGVAYDGIELTLVQPLYLQRDGIELGEGESISGNAYAFAAPFNGLSRNHSRPLHHHRCGFNTHRWVFGADSEVVYCHAIAGRNQTQAAVNASIGYYVSGELVVEASTDGETWQEIGVLGKAKGGTCPIPESLLPTDEVWVRLRARAKETLGADSDPGSFQVNAYSYAATLDGAPVEFAGKTQFVAVEQTDPKVAVTIEGLGDALPGGENTVTATVVNNTNKAIQTNPTVTVLGEAGDTETFPASTTLAPGEQRIQMPYELSGTGAHTVRVSLGEELAYRASATIQVADLFAAHYGETLTNDADATVWWTSSGWKISRPRPAPEARGKAMIIRAARNEVEAAQLVLRPDRALKGLTADSSDLVGPKGGRIPAANVEILRVRYMDVAIQTDKTGAVAPWPDPLPPFREPIDLAPNENQPLWVRVTVPRDVPGGMYKGNIRLKANGYDVTVPLHVEAYDFELPDRMSCVTAFGFSPGLIWRYQKVTDPQQQREVLDKYWQNYSAHHISPYDPTPLDRYAVDWQGLDPWRGGTRDRDQKHAGEQSLLVNDDTTGESVSVYYEHLIPIPEGGLRLRFWYRTTALGHAAIVTFRHHDGNGQWMSGKNNDMRFEGSGEWQLFDKTITSFPAGAASIGLTLWATEWREDGSLTGGVWYDDVSLQDAATGEELVQGGGFESAEFQVKPEFAWDAWDAAMTRAVDELHFNSFRLPIPGLGGGTFHSRTDPSLLGYAEDTPEYQAAFSAYCHLMQEHLREKGWLDEAYVYWFDEPDPKDYAFVMNGFRKLKEQCPDINRMLTEQVEADLVGGPNIWCPVSSHYDHEDAEGRRAEGDDFWWYVCTGPKEPYCTLFIDHPATELRAWLWQTWQRKITGILVWQSNYWTSDVAYPDEPQNPYEDPMGWTTGYSTPIGTRRPWGNGDGRFVYPPEAAADGQQKETVLEGPVDSIRWEMLRDGIEDYEYFAILRELVETKGSALSPEKRAAYEALLEAPDDVTEDMTTFTKDPAPLEAHRDRVARAIEALGRL